MLQTKPLKRVSVIEAASTQLRDLILDGELKPRQQITEKNLTDTWEISRPSVRMVLRELGRTGLITQRPNHAAEVTVFSSDYLLSLEPARRVAEAALTASFLTDLTEMPAATKQKVIASIATIAMEDGGTPESRKLIRAHEAGFHATLLELTNSPRLRDMYALYGHAMIACGNQLDVAYDASRLALAHEELLVQAERTIIGDAPELFEEMMYTHLDDLGTQLTSQLS